MNREIKFRVWNTEMSKWVTGDITNYYDRGAYWFISNDEFKVSQYTGLKDKNGKEIYEGDVVEWEDSMAEETYGGKTIYPNEVVEFKGGAFYPVCMMPENEFEIIGNIYENPELL